MGRHCTGQAADKCVLRLSSSFRSPDRVSSGLVTSQLFGKKTETWDKGTYYRLDRESNQFGEIDGT